MGKKMKAYAYSTNSYYEDRISAGKIPWLKVGDTQREAEERVAEQDGTSNPEELIIKKVFDIPSNCRDYQIHEILKDMGIKKTRTDKSREWFECYIDDVEKAVNQLKHGILRPDAFKMRNEQREAVEKAFKYFTNDGLNFLFNAKMRYGKIFASYQLMKKLKVKKVLVLTYKPQVVKEWHNGLNRHIDFEGNEFYHALDFDKDNPIKFKRGSKADVLFASFQDILGKDLNANIKKKWINFINAKYDLIIIDEVHFGGRTPKAIDLINESNSILITTHTRPDGDACGSMAAIEEALKANNKTITTLLLSETPQWYEFLFAEKPAVLNQDITIDQLSRNQPDLIIILDTNSKNQVTDFAQVLEQNHKPVLILAHHVTSDGLGDIEIIDTSASATAVIVFELFKFADWKINQNVANALFAAICTDTGWFQFNNTDSRSLRICADLIDAGVNPTQMYHDMYQNFSPQRFALMTAMLDSL